MKRTITAPLTPVAPGRVRASVSPSDVGGEQQLERLAHRFLTDYVNAEAGLCPPGLTLVENGIEPREGPDARWITVWTADDDGDGTGELLLDYDDGENENGGASAQENEQKMDTLTKTDTPESLASEIQAMESARRTETDPQTRARMDEAIRHAHSRYGEMMHPERAESIEKAERDRVARSVRDRPIEEAKAEIERRRRSGVPLEKAMRDVTRERAHELQQAA